MGRRRGFVASMFREMEKASDRAAADARRKRRQLDAIQLRALERERVREEKAAERARVRAERDAERQYLAQQREQASQTKQAQKQAAKEAQLRAWQLEFEAHQERETDIDRIGNDAPEVENREAMYAELSIRRRFEPAPFVAPAPHRSHEQAQSIQSQMASDVNAALQTFRADVRVIRRIQAGSAALAIAGLALVVLSGGIGVLLLLVGVAGVAGGHLLANRSKDRQWAAWSEHTKAQFHAKAQSQLMALEASDAQRTHQELTRAQQEHARQTELERRAFQAAESDRLEALAELQAGDLRRMKAALEDALNLELPVPCPATFLIESDQVISVELTLPIRDALPNQEAKLLASGKVAYKAKPDKRLRDQYVRLIAGLALRHASEVMLYLPTCARVNVRGMLSDVNPATGALERRCVLDVAYDYATLAPLTMDGIDPVAALTHFSHSFSLDRVRELKPLHA